jgi:pimeloyl-ACP methyl ester carboxylesterase
MTARFAEIARGRVPADTEVHVVDRSGHFLHLEQPDEVNGLVLDFLTR